MKLIKTGATFQIPGKPRLNGWISERSKNLLTETKI